MSWDELSGQADETPVEGLRMRETELDFDDPINIQYTSGTTGLPKGATLSHHNIMNNGFFVGERERLGPEDRICVPGLLPLLRDGDGQPRRAHARLVRGDPGESFDAARASRPYRASGARPSTGCRRCSSRNSTIRTSIRSTCRPSAPGSWRGRPAGRGHEAGHRPDAHDRVTICYGMTETSPVSFQSLPDDELELRVSTVGAIHPHVEAKIVDPATGRTLPRGETGELCTRGYPVMLGYWNDPEATREAIDRARWMHTGDLAVMREDGYVNIVGRIKDMVIRGGENIYPREIEEFLYTHPAVADVQVIGVPDPKYGEELCAWVRLKEGASATEEEIPSSATGGSPPTRSRDTCGSPMRSR